MRKIMSVVLVLTIVLSLFSGLDFSVFAEAENEPELIDVEIYQAKCLSGIAKDPESNNVAECYSRYCQYLVHQYYSPTQSFLDSCYEDEELMRDYNEWQLYSLAAEPSSALNYVMKKEDYYESLIVSMYSKTMEDSTFKKVVDNRVLNDSTNLLNKVNEIIEVSLNVKPGNDTAIDLLDPETYKFIKNGIEDSNFGSANKAIGALGDVLEYCNDLADVCQRISLYNAMCDLDVFVKKWLTQMHESCDGNTDPALKAALTDLKYSSTGFAEATLVAIKDTSFSIATTLTKTLIDKGISSLASLNPITASLVVGLQAGKTICNVFFATDDICEQLYLMECMYNVLALSRATTNKCKDVFVANQNLDNARVFNFSVDCYFELIINIDIDCMKRFLDTLYNGGVLKGLIKWIYGTTDDYQVAVNSLESLRNTRNSIYREMYNNIEWALVLYYPDTYEYYFSDNNVVPITEISFSTYTILPPGYPTGYADMIVGTFQNLEVQYVPSDTTQRLYTAISDNPKVVEINDSVMTAVAVGTAHVTIISVDNPDVSYTAEIKVGEKKEGSETTQSITNRFNYTVTDGKATITGLVSGYSPTRLTIPSKIQGYPVTRLGRDAFRNCDSLTSITIADSVADIVYRTFYDCDSLTSVTIGNSVTSIGGYAFFSCDSLTSVTIPDSATNIDSSAFQGCGSLISVTIGNSVTRIGMEAFRDCDNLANVTIPDSVTSISCCAFANCKSLTNVYITDIVAWCNISFYDSAANPNYYAENLYLNGELVKNLVIPDTVTSIGSYAFYNCDSLTSVTIPDSATNIGSSAFQGCGSLISVTIGNSVTSIGVDAFRNCDNLVSVTIPDTVTSIGSYAFYNCNSLTNVYITDIAAWCNTIFNNWAANPIYYAENLYLNGELVKNLVIPDTVTSIGSYAFNNCTSLTSVTIPDLVTSIGSSAFKGCGSLISVTIGKSVKSISGIAFYGCRSLTSVNYTGKREDWCRIRFDASEGNPVYYSEKLYINGEGVGNVTVPDDVTNIDYTFGNCDNLTSITIGNGVTSIGDNAFRYCSNLASVTIGNSVTSIGNSAFRYCSNLKDVYYSGTEDEWEKITIATYNDALDTATIHYNCHEHSYTESVTKDPTCTETGIKLVVCTHGESYEETIPALDHSYNFISRVEPTCSKTGMEVYKCSRCNGYKRDVIEIDGDTHTYNEKAVCTGCGKANCIFVPENSSARIDMEKKIISGVDTSIDAIDFLDQISISDSSISALLTANTIGTGTVISVVDNASGEILEEYTIVVFGDYNGDGNADSEDTAYFASIANFEEFEYLEKDYLFMAADINGDGTVDAMDEEDMYAIANFEAYIDHTITSGSKVVRY